MLTIIAPDDFCDATAGAAPEFALILVASSPERRRCNLNAESPRAER
jgi:hypothetical protein